MRARGIKPGFFRNADLVELPMAARLLFVGLWTLADRAGRLVDRPKQIKMDIFPADDVDCDALLEKLAAKESEMLIRYEVDGKRYLQITNFEKHQNPHRDEKPSTIPPPFPAESAVESPEKTHANTVQAPCGHRASTVQIGLTPDSLTPDPLTPDSSILEGERAPSPVGSPPLFLPEYREFIKTERPDLNADVVFANFWEHYPVDGRTVANWRKWVRREKAGPSVAAGVRSAGADPDSRGSIEALGLSLGIGRWDSLVEQWPAYRARVKGLVPA